MSFFNELQRRNVLRVGTAYVVAAWLVIQVVETLFPVFGLSDAAIRAVVIILVIGLIPTLIFSWAYEITPEGLKLEKDVEREESISPQTGKKLDRIIMVVLALALGYFAFDKFVLDPARDVKLIEETAQQARSDALLESFGDNSIAVLPFINMSADPEQEFFSDGITEELLNLLAKIPDLRVTARTSSFFFKGKDLPVSEIAAALNVTHVLEGSVRRDGNQVRITAQLIEARSDTHLWSNTYDRTLDSIFAIQDEVAGAIASALLDSFTGLKIKPTDRANNVAAFEAYRTGRLRWWRRSPDELHKAIELFTQATEHDPRFAPAYAAIADSLLLLGVYGNIPYLDSVERAQPMIHKALALDPDCSEALAAQGLAHWQIGHIDSAESSLRQAVSLNPDYIPARLWLGGVLGEQGRIPEQGVVLQEAMAIDPLNELLAINYAGNLYVRGDYDAVRDLLTGLVQIKPDSPNLLRTLSGYAGGHGELVEAWEYAKRSFSLEPESPAVIGIMAKAWMELGELERAEEVLRAGMEQSSDNADLKTQYLLLMLIAGRIEEAERMVREQFGDDISTLPERYQRFYHFQMGLIGILRDDLVAAREQFEQSIDPDLPSGFDRNHVFSLTMASFLNQQLGDAERASQRLAEAERAVRRARINGIDDADIYYTEAILHVLRDESEEAIEALKSAYERGWRQVWILEIDRRMDNLRDEPEFLVIKRQVEEDILSARAEVNSRMKSV